LAIKEYSMMESSQQRRQMLLKELRTLCKVDCPALVKLHGAFLQNDEVTLVLEYMNGGSLESFFRQCGSSESNHNSNNTKPIKQQQPFLSESLIAAIAYQMLSGLEYLHAPERRMLHRDLKPANALLNRTDGSVKLCDFGMASLLGDHSMNTTVLGTTKFMAPERLRSKSYGRPSDVWSLGLILLECVTGETPWEDVNSMVELVVTLEEIVVSDLIPANVNVSSGLREIILGCLHLEPCKYKETCCVKHRTDLIDFKRQNRGCFSSSFSTFTIPRQTNTIKPSAPFPVVRWCTQHSLNG
jgi:serine/threonine protein kinase